MADINLRRLFTSAVWNWFRRRIMLKHPVPPDRLASNSPQICATNLRARGDESSMPVFDFPRITILPDAEGRKMVRATVVNQRTRAIITIWEYTDGARMLESNFARFRRTRFSAPLKQFLLADLAADVVARLIENGGYDARLTERYRELITDLELRLASSFSTPAPRAARGQAKAANP